jgi:type II secretory pathway component PulJ
VTARSIAGTRAPRRLDPRAGFSLLELVIAATISCAIVILAAQAWRPAGESILLLRDRAIAVGELRMAIERIEQDLGAAVSATPTADGDLHIVREDATATLEGGMSSGGDAGILYTLANGELVRHDVAPGRSQLIATRLTRFELTDLGDGATQIVVGAGHDMGERHVTLTWQP